MSNVDLSFLTGLSNVIPKGNTSGIPYTVYVNNQQPQSVTNATVSGKSAPVFNPAGTQVTNPRTRELERIFIQTREHFINNVTKYPYWSKVQPYIDETCRDHFLSEYKLDDYEVVTILELLRREASPILAAKYVEELKYPDTEFGDPTLLGRIVTEAQVLQPEPWPSFIEAIIEVANHKNTEWKAAFSGGRIKLKIKTGGSISRALTLPGQPTAQSVAQSRTSTIREHAEHQQADQELQDLATFAAARHRTSAAGRKKPPNVTTPNSDAKERSMTALLKDLQSLLPDDFPIDESGINYLELFLYGKDYEHAVFTYKDPIWNGNLYSTENGGDRVYFFNATRTDSRLWDLNNKKGLVALLGHYYSQVLTKLRKATEIFDTSEKTRLYAEIKRAAGGLTSSCKCKSILEMLLPIVHKIYTDQKLDTKFDSHRLQFPLTPLKVFDCILGKIIDLRKEHYWTFCRDIPFDFDTADSTYFEAFLLEIMGGNREKALFLQRWFGYCLTGLTKERKIMIFWGVGNNGKSTILSLIHKILGPFFLEAKKGLIANIKDSDPNAASSALAGIKNVRLMVVSETNSEDKIDVGFSKKFAGGKEQLSARRLHAEEEQFDIQAKLLIQTNNKPEIPPDAKALWNRILFIAFLMQYVDNPDPQDPTQKKIDVDREEKLAQNLPGIFKALMIGARSYNEMGLAPPASVLQETKEYREETDDVAHFLDTTCFIHKNREQKTEIVTVYEGYRFWYPDNGAMSLLSKAKFGEIMASKNLKSFVSNSKRYFPVTFKSPSGLQQSTAKSHTGLTSQQQLRNQIPLI